MFKITNAKSVFSSSEMNNNQGEIRPKPKGRANKTCRKKEKLYS